MELWIDHTSLHASHLCTAGKARKESDIIDFLQLSIKLIYSEHLFVSGYGSEHVIGITRNMINLYDEHGLEKNAIQVIDLSQCDLADVCHRAASTALREFEISLPNFLGVGEGDPKILHPVLSSNEGYGYKLLETILSRKKNVSPNDLEELAMYDLEERAWGQVLYTIYSLPELFRLLRENYLPSYWNQKSVYGLASIIRGYQNDVLAHNNKTYYAPAISRARQQRRSVDIIFRRLETTLADAAKEILPKGLEVPSVIEVIASRAKGDQYGVVDETIFLRNLAKELRSRLATRLKKVDITTEQGIHKLNNEILELSITLGQQLKLYKRPNLLRALLAFQIYFNIPLPNLSSLEEWLEFKQKCHHISVLTELSKSMAYSDSIKRDYLKLLKACTSHVNN